MPSRREVIAGLGALAVRPASAQGDPSRPVTVVVPYPAAGSADVMARLLAAAMGADLGTSFVVDNRGGGAGTIGSSAVARAAPDGHTLLIGTQQTHAANVSLLRRLPYDPVQDFTPIAGLATIPHLLVARRGLGVADMAGLVRQARAKPDGLTYGSTGLGSASHLAMELFRREAGLGPMVHVPFRGVAPMVQELLGGRLDIAMASIPGVVSPVKAGSLMALAVARDRRVPLLPDLPTTTESGVPGVEADAWFALFGPAGMAPGAVDRLYGALGRALGRADVAGKLADQGVVVDLRPGAEVAAGLPGEIRRWAEIVQAAGITSE